MLRKLDRYVFLSFFYPYILSLVLILAMVVVVETSERMNRLLQYDGDMSLPKLLAMYFLYQIPQIVVMIAPVITLTGVTAALVRLARQNEIIALQASGVSMKRIGLPLLVGGLLCAAAAGILQEVVVPGTARAAQDVTIRLSGRDVISKNVYAIDPVNGLWLFAAELDVDKGEFRNGMADQPSVTSEDTSPMIISTGRWNEEEKAWYVTGHREITRHDREREPFENERLTTNLTPQDLVLGSPDRSQRSLAELSEFARKLPAREADLRTEVQRRLAYPLANIVLLLLVIPLVIDTSGQASIKGIGFAVLVTLAFYMVVMGMLDLGYRGHLSPVLAAWSPYVAFSAIGTWMYSRFHG